MVKGQGQAKLTFFLQKTLPVLEKLPASRHHLKMNNNKEIGQIGECAAAKLLQRKKLRVLERNWRPPAGMSHGQALEIDIIAKSKETLIFVEVKTRNIKQGSTAPPEDNFTHSKQRKMLKAAKLYLTQHKAWEQPCRFDFIGVTIAEDGTLALEHFENVISTNEHPWHAMGSGYSPW